MIFDQREKIAGLSITEESVGFLFLKKKGKKTVVSHLNERVLAEGIIQNGSIANKERLVNAIKEVLPPRFLTAWREPRKVVISIPESIVHYTNFPVPKTLKRQRLEGSITAYLEQHSPLPLEKLYYDWEEYSLSAKQKGVFIGFAERNTVDGYLEAVRQAGCHPIAVEGEFLSVRRLLSQDAPTVQLLLLIGPRRITFLILKNSVVAFSRSLVGRQDATALKKELTRVMEYYLTEYPDAPPMKKLSIVASSTSTQLIAGIKASIEADLKIKVEEVRIPSPTKASGVLEGVADRAILPKGRDSYISLMVPGTEELFHETRLLLASKIVNDFMIIVSVILVLVFSGVSFYLLPTYEEQKESQIARKRAQPSLQEITELEKRITDFNALVEPLAIIEQNSPDWIIPITDVVLRTRGGISITNMSMNIVSKTVVITGVADDIGFLLDFKSALSFSGVYEGNLSIPFSSFEKEKDIPFSYALALRDPSILYPRSPQKTPPPLSPAPAPVPR